MKSTPRLLLLLPMFIASAAFAADTAPAAPAAAPAEHHGEHAKKEKKVETELSGKMEKMGGAFRKLRRQAADATQNADSLQQVAILREYAEASLKYEPYKAGEVPAADRAKLIEGYQAKMKDFLAGVTKLEAAFKANDNAAADKIVQDLIALQKEGHKAYKSKAID